MVWAPQLLYIFHNAPIWFPHKWFTQINAQFRDLIWGTKKLQISLHTLWLTKEQGGLAVPHARIYFVASQIQHLGGWGDIDADDPIRSLLIPDRSPLPAIAHLEASLVHISQTLPTINLLNTVWKFTRSILKITGPCEFTPIWRNKYYKELLNLKDFRSWEAKDIHYISQLFNGNVFKSFSDLQNEFMIPRTQFFQYLQLRHAIQSERRVSPLGTVTHPLMSDVLKAEGRKGMILRIYSKLFHSIHDASKLPSRWGWEKDLGPIDREKWEL